MREEWVKVSLERGVGSFNLQRELRELGHLVVMEVEFNTDTQLVELALRSATNEDI